MNISNQREMSAKMLGVGKSKVWFNADRISEVKEAITKHDIRSLIKKKVIQRKPELHSSRVRARKRLVQRRKGRQKGPGTKKGTSTSRLGRKEAWMITVRGQRAFIKELRVKDHITVLTYRNLYSKVKGGYFRNKRHIKLYLIEHKLGQEKK
ncbi:50S ribosomal protein L19e [Candidatus Woesearchaeota archaeon]|nr:50S ribosomal protein L19e [Candidatus Woesearchaeota archaeon]